MHPFDSFSIDVNAIATCVFRGGDGHAVLMVHGGAPGACTSVNWKLNLRPLAEAGLAVYGYDQPGFGRSTIPTDHSMEFRVQHARALVDALGLNAYHLVANSQGAYIAARLALEDERVRKVVLVSSATLSPPGSEAAQAQSAAHVRELRAYTPGVEQMRAMTQRTLFDQSLVTDELVRERAEMSSGPLHVAYQERSRLSAPAPVYERLSGLGNPVLVMCGREDRGVPLERSLRLCEQIPNAELHVFGRCGHWVQWDQADRFNAMVAEFLTR
jgi:pimeloyl-ACP methyl ester carboxylesterase